MDITKRSTSPLMRQLFGEDIGIIAKDYNNHIAEIAKKNPCLKGVFSECTNRTGFLLPYLSAEYGYYSVKGSFIPMQMKKIVMGFGLIGLAVSIDDDVSDEYSYDHLKMVQNVSASELIQNLAYRLIFESDAVVESKIVMSEISNALSSTAVYQCADAENIASFDNTGFDISKYLYAARKTSCPIKYGLRLGMLLGNGNDYTRTGEFIGEHLGIVLQLIDDLIDINDDIKNYKGSVTLPIFLINNGISIEIIFNMIDRSLCKCTRKAKNLPFRNKICQMIKGFYDIKNSTRTKFYEKLLKDKDRMRVLPGFI
ncbi:MAG: polyprenyl synthetase family protein [Candidatus Aenigmatarchaeota archaeon]